MVTMHGKRTNGSRPPSPRMGRSGGGKGWWAPRPKSGVERLLYAVLATLLRRRGFLLLAPLLYVSAMPVFLGRWNLDSVPVRVRVAVLHRRPPPGAVYRSPRVFERLWPFMQADVNHSIALMTAWHQKASQRWKPCVNKRLSHAGLLNATLVIPIFHLNSVWRDSSKFGEIFDEEYFIETLKNDVRVVKQLPEDILKRFDYNISKIINMRTKALSSKTYYLQKVLPKLRELGAVRIAPFSNRLAHSVPSNIQGLRCLTNYEALRFSQPIRLLAENMVDRMVKNSSMSGGKYVSVHLRFEADMVAFSCCTYDGGKEEKHEMDVARERSWRGKFRRHGRKINPEANRMNGRCPLTPLEVGMMLRGMGFDNNTSVYVASGQIYNAEKFMAPLHQLFPHLETKDTLASTDELAPFKGHSSRLAALDYTMCANSEVFVTTQGGNFPHFMMGHRRYLYEGHSKTIKPDKRRLVLSFDNPNIRWDRFKHNMQEVLHYSDLKGVGLRKSDASLYTFPMPDCMCPQSEA
uniref:O-fucosyltransferase family protein n=1 Tax=Elaeis guineensis var. tenera TaxID=51953 RepID=A0A8N4IC30_ELAGV|nr:O-fucosyltransferase 9 isoform X2 [Elaeis guineensis]